MSTEKLIKLVELQQQQIEKLELENKDLKRQVYQHERDKKAARELVTQLQKVVGEPQSIVPQKISLIPVQDNRERRYTSNRQRPGDTCAGEWY